MDPVKKYYEKNLDGLDHFGFGDHHKRIIDMLSKEKKSKLLDVGCGNSLGGILITGVPNNFSLQARLAMFFLGESQFVTYPYVTHPHIRMFSTSALKKHNFRSQKTQGANWFMFQYTRKNAQIIENNKPVEYNWNSWLKIMFWIKYNIFSHFPLLSQTIIVKSIKN